MSQPPSEATAVGHERHGMTWGRAMVIATVGGLLMAAVIWAGGCLLYVPQYEASAWLRIGGGDWGGVSAPRDREEHSFVENQLQLIRSPLIADAVVSQAEIAKLSDVAKQKEPSIWLQKRVSVRQVGESDLFTVSFCSADARTAETIVKAVTNAFFQRRDEQEAKRLKRVIVLLEQERNRRIEDVRRLRDQVRVLTKQATGKDPFGPQDAAGVSENHPLVAILEALTSAEVSRRLLEARVEAAAKIIAEKRLEVPDYWIQEHMSEDPSLQELQQYIDRRRADLLATESTSAKGGRTTGAARLKEEIQQAEANLARSRTEVYSQVKSRREEELLSQKQEKLASMQSDLEEARITEGVLRKNLEDVRREMGAAAAKGSGETLELEFARDELARAKELVNLYSRRIMEEEDRQKAPARVELWREPEVPKEPAECFPYRALSLASLAGFCVPYVLMGVWVGLPRLGR